MRWRGYTNGCKLDSVSQNRSVNRMQTRHAGCSGYLKRYELGE